MSSEKPYLKTRTPLPHPGCSSPVILRSIGDHKTEKSVQGRLRGGTKTPLCPGNGLRWSPLDLME